MVLKSKTRHDVKRFVMTSNIRQPFVIQSKMSPPPHANACTGHNFVTNTPIKFIFAIAMEVPDYKNLMIVGINRKNIMASGGHFV